MSTEIESLYEFIEENLINGELPRDFTLPLEVTKHSIPFVDGAKDGIEIYHTYSHGMAEGSISILEEMLHAVSEDDYASGIKKLKEFAEKNLPVAAINDFQRYIVKQDWLDNSKFLEFALICILKPDVEIVKYGLQMTELLKYPSEGLKVVVRTLGLCNEFTIFAIFNMLRWDNSNDEIFALAKKVYGWGRIHAVKYLKAENDEIKKWLLEEGVNNDIHPDYTEMEGYQKVEL